MQLDLQPVQPKLDLQPVTAMSPGNAAKMQELYPDIPKEGAPKNLDLKPVSKLDLKPLDLKPLDLKPIATTAKTGGNFVREQIAKDKVGLDDVTKPLKETFLSGKTNLENIGKLESGETLPRPEFDTLKKTPREERTLTQRLKAGEERLGNTIPGQMLAAGAKLNPVTNAVGNAVAPVIKAGSEMAGVDPVWPQTALMAMGAYGVGKGALGKVEAELPKGAPKPLELDVAEKKSGQLPDGTNSAPQKQDEKIGAFKSELKPISAKPTDVADELSKLSNKDEARRVNAVRALQTIQGVPEATWEKLYAHKDNPKIPLTPEETKIFQTTTEPVSRRSAELIAKLKKSTGQDFGEVGAAPRRVKGKNELVERIYGNDKEAKNLRRGGKGLSTFSPAAMSRSMWALPGEVGKRRIVFIDDGKIFENGKQIGEITGKDNSPAAGKETPVGKLQQATTSEIEAATKVSYHKNLLANEYLRWQSLERANDAAELLDRLKQSPEFMNYAARPGNNRELPDSWRKLKTENREFDGWKFDPHMAEVFEDYLGNVKSPEEFSDAVMNVARATKASIFINPIRHMINATNMFGTSLGAAGAVKNIATMRLPVAMMKATRDVLTQNRAFRDAAREGLAMPSMRSTAQEFHQELIRAMGREISSKPKEWNEIAKQWGYDSTVGMVKDLYKGSNKLLWAYSDILTYSRYQLYRMNGLSAKEAVKRTEQVMPSYKVPSRVAGSRNASLALQDPRATLFGRYDYNRFANLSGLVKRSLKLDKPSWEARDQLVALAIITTVGYKFLDKWLQTSSGNPDAHQAMGGFSDLYNIGDAMLDTERKSPAQAAMSAFSPGLFALPFEAVSGQNIYTGKPILQRGDWNDFLDSVKSKDFDSASLYAKRMGYDVSADLLGKFAPLQDIGELATGTSPEEFWMGQLGASFPKDNTKSIKYERGAEKSAARKRGF